MFTGIVQGVGTVRAIEPRGGDVTLVFDTAGVSLAAHPPGAGVPPGSCKTLTRPPSAAECSTTMGCKGRVEEASQRVMQGRGCAEPMAEANICPNTMLQMIRVGEQTGELAAQLDNVAGFFNDELDYAVDKMTEWFEPIMIIFIGAVVGFVALAMVSAMYGIYGQVEL